MPGTVVTFYSYKGGVGRSFTLANIAVLLARWGRRVLCLDWDLEAPGLHDYFQPMISTPPAGGVIDLISDFLEGRSPPLDHTVRLSGAGVLDFLAAGRQDADYVGRVQGIDWDHLYELGFGDYLESCREQWTADYDFVLLDSRTGVSDVGSICTAHLPDRLVVLFTANMQSLRGAVEIAERAGVARDPMPYDRAKLTIMPLLSRFDTREEYDRSEKWRQTALSETRGLFDNWLNQRIPPELIARHLTLPYVSYWSFGEQLPVLFESNPSADQIGFALETVAALIAHDFDRTDLLAENRDAYVAAARATKRQFVHDLRVSTPRSTLKLANELIAELGALGVRAERSLSGDRSLLTKLEDDARHLCLVIDGKVSRWQTAEVDLFLHRTLGQERRIIPVLTADADPNALPGHVGNLRYVKFSRSDGPAEVARGLAKQINGSAPRGGDLLDTLRRVAGASLPPPLWEIVDEIVRALLDAITAHDDAKVSELGDELALEIRPRVARRQDMKAPPETREVIEWVVRRLESVA
ncbi:CATRA system-associated protein [Kibdelosporangium persicum]|uniref:CobQ/CobB/MinD/ParA nucleotide binding domain-containing protein n=1 Tax=Kibdelosporangium persicum TaxID=2698649 RepID=A0ABX2FH55_9PSEU|nr:CATRA system-associated protein [Kibdelosporangium persicum]NRN70597.1 CobQ/CobB/MinD/ParA nucleotide binding domain-containing protein [Kibdelosporangium persicum]